MADNSDDGSTVLLVGVGADSSNVRPVPNLVDSDRYDYIPIPETWLTAGQYTYGEFALDQGEENIVAADKIDRIRPFDSDGDWITDSEVIRQHPVHHDPNFEDFSYGDKRDGDGSALAELESGDVLGFYTGIDDGHRKHRYIWGYFTVDEVADLEGLDSAAYRDRLRDFPENAHAKRLLGAGKAKHEGPGGKSLVIVDGRNPGEKLNHPIKISTTIDNSQYPDDDIPGNTYWLSEKFISEFEYDLNRHSLNTQTGLAGVDRKHALWLNLGVEEFENQIKIWQSRQY